jgi:hypothetical protein
VNIQKPLQPVEPPMNTDERRENQINNSKGFVFPPKDWQLILIGVYSPFSAVKQSCKI